MAHARSQAEAARDHYRAALESYKRLGNRQWIGGIHQRLARIASEPAERAEHVRLARANWKPLDLPPEFLDELDDEFGPEPASDIVLLPTSA
ncbi:hypothetical protein J0H58_26235 [bacterium]|nr:hypothetical protein [bacterium]